MVKKFLIITGLVGVFYVGFCLYSAKDSFNFLFAQSPFDSDSNKPFYSSTPNEPINEENVTELLHRNLVHVVNPTIDNDPAKAPEKKNYFIERFIKPLQVNMDKVVAKELPYIGEMFQDAQTLAKILSNCLNTEDLCGQRQQFADLTYFDPTITPYHRDLNRSLLAISAIIRKDKSFINDLDKDMLIENLKNENHDTPLLSTEILLQTDLDVSTYQAMLENSKNMQAPTKALFLDLLAGSPKMQNSEYKELFLKELYSALSDNSDQYVAWEVQRNLFKYKLTEGQFKTAVSYSCHLKSVGIGEDLWPVIRKDLVNQIERSGMSINPDEICKDQN